MWKNGFIYTAAKNVFRVNHFTRDLGEVMTKIAINAQRITSTTGEGQYNRFLKYSNQLESKNGIGIFDDIDKNKLRSVIGTQAFDPNTANWGIRFNLEPFMYEDEDETNYTQAAHEAFYTCFAAYHDIGPVVMACTSVKGLWMFDVAIYLMESGVPGDILHNTINDYTLDEVKLMGTELRQLFEDSRTHKLLMIDGKPGNMVWVRRPGLITEDEGFVSEDDDDDVDKGNDISSSLPRGDWTKARLIPKFIDFDVHFTIKLLSVDDKCIHYLNSLLFLSHIACHTLQSGNDHKLSLLYQPLMNELVTNNEFFLNNVTSFCVHLYNLKLEDVKSGGFLDLYNANLRTVGDRVLLQLQHYCEKWNKLTDRWPKTFQPIRNIYQLIERLRVIMLDTQKRMRNEDSSEGGRDGGTVVQDELSVDLKA
jgi:hypothetical protein